MGRTDLLRRLGATYADLERQGVFLAVSEARVRFRGSAGYDDRVRVHTRLARLRSRGVRFHYTIESADASGELAEAETDLVCLDRGGSPRVLPEAVRELLQGALARETGEGTIRTPSGVSR